MVWPLVQREGLSWRIFMPNKIVGITAIPAKAFLTVHIGKLRNSTISVPYREQDFGSVELTAYAIMERQT